MVAGRGLLLERGFVFLVDDDQPRMRSRSEDRTAGTHHHLHPAGGDPLPVAMAFGIGQVAVQHGHRIEPGTEAADGLRCEADFRNQDDHLPAVRNHLAHGADVDLRLPAAGHAVQQKRPMRAGTHRLQDRLQHAVLIGGQHGVGVSRHGRDGVGGSAGIGAQLECGDPALLPQSMDRRRTASGSFRQSVDAHRLLRIGQNL